MSSACAEQYSEDHKENVQMQEKVHTAAKPKAKPTPPADNEGDVLAVHTAVKPKAKSMPPADDDDDELAVHPSPPAKKSHTSATQADKENFCPAEKSYATKDDCSRELFNNVRSDEISDSYVRWERRLADWEARLVERDFALTQREEKVDEHSRTNEEKVLDLEVVEMRLATRAKQLADAEAACSAREMSLAKREEMAEEDTGDYALAFAHGLAHRFKEMAEEDTGVRISCTSGKANAKQEVAEEDTGVRISCTSGKANAKQEMAEEDTGDIMLRIVQGLEEHMAVESALRAAMVGEDEQAISFGIMNARKVGITKDLIDEAETLLHRLQKETSSAGNCQPLI